MSLIKHPKRRGEWVELQFMARASAHGLTVNKPWGDSARYDFVVEKDGHFLRVQVKATSFRHSRGYLCSCARRTLKGPVSYTVDEIDFVVAYIIPEDIWYVIPFRELTAIEAAILLAPRRPKNRHYRFMEAWHLLTQNVSSAGGGSE